MSLSDAERERLNALLAEYRRSPEVQRMRRYIQHGRVTTYDHCENVARVSFWLNRRLKLGSNEADLAVGAFLHDFYLYDWHKGRSIRSLRDLSRSHGFMHPLYARRNAQRFFRITAREKNIIESHMWPLTIRHVPTCREAVIVCLADKYCACAETLLCRHESVGICV